MRSLPGGKWDRSAGHWVCSDEPGCVQPALAIAASLNAEVCDDVRQLLDQHGQRERLVTEDRVLRAKKAAHRLGLALKPRQDEGIVFLATRKAALLAAKPGTGKTMMALFALPNPAPPVLVVGPESAKWVWEAEILRWRPDLRPVVLKPGKANFRLPSLPGEVVITTYDSVMRAERKGNTYVLPIAGVDGMTLILDEAHKVKNPTAQRTQNARALVRAALTGGGCVWGMTGTPVQNRPGELWSLLYTLKIAEQAFGSWPQFQSLFMTEVDPWGRPLMGLPKPEIRDRLARVSLQIPLVLEVGEPEVSYLPVDITLTAAEKAEGQELFGSWREALKGDGSLALAWASMAPYRKMLALKKLKALEDYISTAEDSDEPLVVFCCHKDPIKELGARKGWAHIDGDVGSERPERIADFQAGRIKGIALTTRAGSEAVTLTRSRTVLFIDLDYNPSVNKQAVARCHRTGQTRRVRVVIAVARGTIDRDILSILEAKGHLVESIENPK